MQESPFNLAPKHMPLSHNSPVLTASCQMLMAVYRPGGIRWHMHISLTTMFYMPRKCTLIRLCLELASAMSLVGSALPSLHLSPTLSLPFPWPSHVSCLTWDIPHGSFSAMKGLSGSWEWFVGSSCGVTPRPSSGKCPASGLHYSKSWDVTCPHSTWVQSTSEPASQNFPWER